MTDASTLSAKSRRIAMPETARVFAEFNAEFGVLWFDATENGHTYHWKIKETALQIAQRNEGNARG